MTFVSVPAIRRFMFSRWRMITINEIAVAATSKGQSVPTFQPGMMIIATIKTSGKATEATMEASEMYRHIKTSTAQTAKAMTAQIV